MKTSHRNRYGFKEIQHGQFKVYDQIDFTPKEVRLALASWKAEHRHNPNQWYYTISGERHAGDLAYTLVYLAKSKEELVKIKLMSKTAAAKYIWSSNKAPDTEIPDAWKAELDKTFNR